MHAVCQQAAQVRRPYGMWQAVFYIRPVGNGL
jgi:hypothetical protein